MVSMRKKKSLQTAIAGVRRNLPCEDRAMVLRLVDAVEALAELRDPGGLPTLLDALEATWEIGANARLIDLVIDAEFPVELLESAVEPRRGQSDFEWDLLFAPYDGFEDPSDEDEVVVTKKATKKKATKKKATKKAATKK